MPSTYAHRRFGADVLERLPAELQEKIAPYRELYDIGLHGPDLLFYYHAAKSTPVSALGNAMHEQPGAVFFERARGVVNKAKNRDAGLPLPFCAGLHLPPPRGAGCPGQRREPLRN